MSTMERRTPSDTPELVRQDPWLGPHCEAVKWRINRFEAARQRLCEVGGSLDAFASGYEYYGLNRGERDGEPGVWYREWAPNASALHLIGDFNNWDRAAHPMARDEFGVWSLFLPDRDYAERLTHGSRLKVRVDSAVGAMDRMPAYIRRAVSDERHHDFSGQHWAPPEPHRWINDPPPPPKSLRIYEAHVGMSSEHERVATYADFANKVLPRIASAGYNAVQLMAIQEHPYYGSFGYQVSSFYAPSSRFGTPEDLMTLIDRAHGYGLIVLLDIVHSHAVKNINEGLNLFDGTEHQYFHAGGRGQHPAWDSLCFDYAKTEVLRFLLSNVRYWLKEFRFDGFRFDGVTSMVYLDHGLGRHFSSYDEYFPPHVDEDAITYLQLANEVAHAANPNAISIAEDVSGMVGMARPTHEGGLGFDYRLAMGVPDYWIKLLKEKRDDDWNMSELYHTLVNRRYNEKHVAYAESHDQALVGDKTIAFRLMDADMYYHMTKTSQNVIVERGMALHKMIRLITFALGGEAYLNFMGNEFGHPEWIDFPREGNNYSYKYARRQWALVDDHKLRFGHLAAFDRAMLRLDTQYGVVTQPQYELLQVHEDRKLLMFFRGPLLFVFNFHPNGSWADHRVGTPTASDYELVLTTDDPAYDGYGRVAKGQRYPRQDEPSDYRQQSIQVYAPSRSALVLAPAE